MTNIYLVATLSNITNQNDSLIMFEYLKQHPEQELYLIMGANKYGCGSNGELVQIKDMSPEKVKNGYCINPFYVKSDIIIEAEPQIEQVPVTETVNDIILIENEELKNRLAEVQYNLADSLKTIESYSDSVLRLEAENQNYNVSVAQLTDELKRQTARADLAEEILNDDSKVSKFDLRELCKAITSLGFEVDLSYFGDCEEI